MPVCSWEADRTWFWESRRKVRGIRFYSAGLDGKYTDGAYRKGDGGKSDDWGFDLVEAEVPASGKSISGQVSG